MMKQQLHPLMAPVAMIQSLSKEAMPRGSGMIQEPLDHSDIPTSTNLLEAAALQWRQLFSRAQQSESSRTRPTTLTTANNLRANVPWGDTLRAKSAGVTRLYSINVNGISINSRGGKFDDICRFIKEVQADIIFCGQEHNLDTTQFRIRSSLFEAARQHWQRHRLVVGTTPITVEKAYKPGGR
jgi:hypothetical protein